MYKNSDGLQTKSQTNINLHNMYTASESRDCPKKATTTTRETTTEKLKKLNILCCLLHIIWSGWQGGSGDCVSLMHNLTAAVGVAREGTGPGAGEMYVWQQWARLEVGNNQQLRVVIQSTEDKHTAYTQCEPNAQLTRLRMRLRLTLKWIMCTATALELNSLTHKGSHTQTHAHKHAQSAHKVGYRMFLRFCQFCNLIWFCAQSFL